MLETTSTAPGRFRPAIEPPHPPHGALCASLDGDLLGRYGFAKLFTLPEATPWEFVRKRSR
jgi:hypothetical protein